MYFGAGAAAITLMIAHGTKPATPFNIRIGQLGGLGATAPFPGIGYGQSILVEAIATFLMMLVIMGVAVDKRAPPGFAGLIIGLTVAGMITATGNIAVASLNTARTFGPYMMDFLLGGPNLWVFFPIYIIGPVIGAVVAAVFYDRITAE